MEVAARRGMRRAPTRMHAYLRCAGLAALERWGSWRRRSSRPRRPRLRRSDPLQYRYRAPAALLASEPRRRRRGPRAGGGGAERDAGARARVRPAADPLRSRARCPERRRRGAGRGAGLRGPGDGGAASGRRGAARAAHPRRAGRGAPARRATASSPRPLALTERFGFEGLWTRRERRRAAILLARALPSGSGRRGLRRGWRGLRRRGRWRRWPAWSRRRRPRRAPAGGGGRRGGVPRRVDAGAAHGDATRRSARAGTARGRASPAGRARRCPS